MLDAAELEKRGIHTVTIVWDTLVKAARIAARIQGVPELKLAITPNLKGTDGAEIQRAKARDLAPEIAALLLEG